MATLTTPQPVAHTAAPAPFNVTRYLHRVSSGMHLQRIHLAAVSLAAEIASPDFEGWSDFWAAPDAVLDTMLAEHTYAQWRQDGCADDPTDRDLQAVGAVWRLAYLTQAAAFNAELGERA